MIYGKLGATPLSIDVNIRTVVYWEKLVSSNVKTGGKNNLHSNVEQNSMFHILAYARYTHFLQ